MQENTKYMRISKTLQILQLATFQTSPFELPRTTTKPVTNENCVIEQLGLNKTVQD